MKKLLSLVLAALLLLGMTSAFAAEPSTYRMLYSGEATTLNYLITASTNEFAIAANVIDTLVEYDNLGQIQPSLAESWEVSEDGLTWTFHLRKGVQWVNGKAEPVAELKAQDFVDAAAYILNAQNASATANILYSVIAGAKEYFDGTATPEAGKEAAPKTEWDTVGVKAVDDYTLQYQLTSPVPYFLSMTTYVCFMPVNGDFLREKGADFGLATGNDTILYNGAYYISEFKPQEKRVYSKNPLNWDAEHVYLETIESTFNKEATTLSPEMYKRGEVDTASIDTAIARQWLQDPALADLIRPVRQSGFYSYFYALNFNPLFDAAYEPENWKLESDSISQNFTAKISELDSTQVVIKSNFVVGKKYKLTVPKNTVISFYNRLSESVRFDFEAAKPEEFGSFTVNLVNKPEHNFWIQLLNDKSEPVYQKFSNESLIKFINLKPASYKLRILVDNNDNGFWDSSDFATETLSEDVYLYKKAGDKDIMTKINIRPMWEINENWDLTKEEQSVN